jgi:hypothetical protein
MVESAFEVTAVSPKEAAGLWQIIPTTGQEWGLAIAEGYDGRFDIHLDRRGPGLSALPEQTVQRRLAAGAGGVQRRPAARCKTLSRLTCPRGSPSGGRRP